MTVTGYVHWLGGVALGVAVFAACSGSSNDGPSWGCSSQGDLGCSCGASIAPTTTDCRAGIVKGVCTYDGKVCSCIPVGCSSSGDQCTCSLLLGGAPVCEAPSGGTCCFDTSVGQCSCYAPGTDDCQSSSAVVVPSCDLADTNGYYERYSVAMDPSAVSVQDCNYAAPAALPPGGLDASTGPDADSCLGSTDYGTCGPTADACTCGLSCLMIGNASYECEWPCSSDADCAGKVDPYSGESKTSCDTQIADQGFQAFCYDPQ